MPETPNLLVLSKRQGNTLHTYIYIYVYIYIVCVYIYIGVILPHSLLRTSGSALPAYLEFRGMPCFVQAFTKGF